MQLSFFDEIGNSEWDQFARHSHDAWFWHTSGWMDYTKEFAGDKFVKNSSFFIFDNSKILAICPAIIEKNGGSSEHHFSYSSGPIPFPALHNQLAKSERMKVLKLYVEKLNSISENENVSYIGVKVPSLSLKYLTHSRQYSNPILRFGFVDLPYHTQVISLDQTVDQLWSDIRKGHKADIRRGENKCKINIWGQNSITSEKFMEYQLLHQKDAGRVTRSQKTFDLMFSWIKNGNSILVEAEYDGRGISYALLILFQQGAYYGSSCKDPDYFDIPASHLVQWNSICWLKENNFKWYDIGIQQFAPQWFDLATPKDISISFFKRGFGGSTIPLSTVERFYSTTYYMKTYQDRMQKFAALHSEN